MGAADRAAYGGPRKKQGILDDEPSVRRAVTAAGGNVQRVKAVAVANPASVRPWLALAELTFRQDSPVESYAYARLAHDRALARLEAAGWQRGERLPWSVEANRPALRTFFLLRRLAGILALPGEKRELTSLLLSADPEALERLEAETPVPPAPPTETIVIRGAD
jgi:hypothetical protein